MEPRLTHIAASPHGARRPATRGTARRCRRPSSPTIAPMSSMTATPSRKVISVGGTRRPRSGQRAPGRTRRRWPSGSPTPAAGPARGDGGEDQRRHDHAAQRPRTSGSSAAWRVDSSPTASSRFTSRPMTRKKSVIRPSLTTWSRSSLDGELADADGQLGPPEVRVGGDRDVGPDQGDHRRGSSTRPPEASQRMKSWTGRTTRAARRGRAGTRGGGRRRVPGARAHGDGRRAAHAARRELRGSVTAPPGRVDDSSPTRLPGTPPATVAADGRAQRPLLGAGAPCGGARYPMGTVGVEPTRGLPLSGV